jgi:hypothetical protein
MHGGVERLDFLTVFETTTVEPFSTATSGVSGFTESTWMVSFAPLLMRNASRRQASMAGRPLKTWPSSEVYSASS